MIRQIFPISLLFLLNFTGILVYYAFAVPVPKSLEPSTEQLHQSRLIAVKSGGYQRDVIYAEKLVYEYTFEDDVNDENLTGILKACPNFPFCLSLKNQNITDEAIKTISQHRNLEGLILEGTKISSTTFIHLAKIENLKYLNLSRTNIESKKTAEYINNNSSLRFLSLEGCALDDDFIKEITKRHERLTHLHIGNTTITSRSFKLLDKFPNLVELHINDLSLDEKDIFHLKSLPKLTSISFTNIKLSTAHLSAISELTNLTSINLHNTQICDADVKIIKKMKKLDSINFSSNDVDGRSLFELSNLPIRNINLARTKVTAKHLKELSNYKHLQILDISNNGLIVSELDFLPKLKELKSLNISFNRLAPEGIDIINNCQSIIHLHLAGSKINNDDLVLILESKKYQTLNISLNNISDKVAKAIGSQVELRTLQIAGTDITSNTINKIKDLQLLKYIDIVGTTIDANETQQIFPACEIKSR